MLDIDLKNLKPPYLIHSDIFRASCFLKKEIICGHNGSNINEIHLRFLSKCFGNDNLIFPSFNYDFPRSKIFNIKTTPSQVGDLTNYVLNGGSFHRTKTPMFSFLTKMNNLTNDYHNAPFGYGSVFDYIFNNDGSIIFYGTGVDSCTYLHFVEFQFGPPIYRYDKTFSGTLIDGADSTEVDVSFHVRPLGLNLDYKWDYLYELLNETRSIIRFTNNFFAVKARRISDIWGNVLQKNPFSILDEQARPKVEQKWILLGRRFLISDFEVSS